MANNMWACPSCEMELRFKGLCRDCTEYDSSGNPTKPVHRVKKNSQAKDEHNHKTTKEDYINSRRPKPSKKQLTSLMEQLNANSHIVTPHIHTDDCDHSHDEEEDFTPIGEEE